jgi:predicted nucleic acid-binding protein
MIIIDTDVMIDLSHGIQDAENLIEKLTYDTIAISIITVMEIMRGCRNQKEILSATEFLNLFESIHVSESISQNCVELIARYSTNYGLSIPDAFIAATCIITDSELYTRNIRHFQMIDGLKVTKPY